MAGPIHKERINRIPSPDQLGLVHNWLWDSLTINWDGVEMTSGNEMIQLPRTIVVPFTAKFKVRQLLTAQKFSVSMALLQNNNWHDLNQKSHRLGGPSASIRRTPSAPAPRYPDSQPLLRLVNTRTSSVSEDRMHILSNMEQQAGGTPPPISPVSLEITSQV